MIEGIPPEILKELPPPILEKIRLKSVSLKSQETTKFSISRSAPLPPPSELAAYNEIIPQGADRIMKMCESQTSHRIAMESKVIYSQQGQETRGQVFGFLIALVGLVCGTYAAVSGQPVAGAVIGGTPLVGLVSVFVYSKKRDKADLAEKEEQMESVKPKSPPSAPNKKKK
jgi:uncharacterized membrane protein